MTAAELANFIVGVRAEATAALAKLKTVLNPSRHRYALSTTRCALAGSGSWP